MKKFFWLVIVASVLASTPAMAQDAIPFSSLHYGSGSPNVSDWIPTAHITRIEFRANDVSVEFDRHHGPTRWPDVTPPGWDGPIQYTLWPVITIHGEWWTFGSIEFWEGRPGVGGPFSRAAVDWYFNAPEMAPFQARDGDLVGFFVTAGDQRLKDVHAVKERSYIVTLTVPRNDSGVFTFDVAPTPVPDPVPTPTPTPVPVFDPAPLLAAIDELQTVNAAQNTRLQLQADMITGLTAETAALRATLNVLSCSASVFGLGVHCQINGR